MWGPGEQEAGGWDGGRGGSAGLAVPRTLLVVLREDILSVSADGDPVAEAPHDARSQRGHPRGVVSLLAVLNVQAQQAEVTKSSSASRR